MKLNRLVMMIVLALLCSLGATSASAQMQNDGSYTIQKNDTLWDLSEVYYHNPFLWKQIVEKNPFLAEPGRQFTATARDGHKLFVVLLHPGESLVGLGDLGIVPKPVEPNQLVERIGTLEVQGSSFVSMMGWLLAAILLVAGLLIAAWAIMRQRPNQHVPAALGGPPVIPGGLPADGDRATTAMYDRFQRIADERHAALDHRSYVAGERPIRVSEIEDGFLNGRGIVEYDANERLMRTFYNEPAYRATFRFPDGHQEQIVFLQQCGNDVTMTRYRNFTFTRTRMLQQPVEPVTPAVPAAQVTAPVVRVLTPPAHEGTVLRYAGSTVEVPEGSTLDLTADGVVVRMPGGAIFNAKIPEPGVAAVAGPKAAPERSTG